MSHTTCHAVSHLDPSSRLQQLPKGFVVLDGSLEDTMGLPLTHEKRGRKPEHVPLTRACRDGNESSIKCISFVPVVITDNFLILAGCLLYPPTANQRQRPYDISGNTRDNKSKLELPSSMFVPRSPSTFRINASLDDHANTPHLGLCPSDSTMASNCFPRSERKSLNCSRLKCHNRCTKAQSARTTSGEN